MTIVYILTNERMKQLDNTSMPLPFECFYAVGVKDASLVERKMHQDGIDL